MTHAIQNTMLLATVSALAACGGSSSPSPPENQPEASSACDTQYHNTIRGSYSGQIEYRSPDYVESPEQCTWEVSLSVATESDLNDICQTGFDHQSQLVSGGSACSDLATTGVVDNPTGLNDDEPQWPMDIALTSPVTMDLYRIYPSGNARNNGRWSYVLDGRGNAGFDDVAGLAGYTGTLVQFSDEPYQLDDGVGLVVQGDKYD